MRHFGRELRENLGIPGRDRSIVRQAVSSSSTSHASQPRRTPPAAINHKIDREQLNRVCKEVKIARCQTEVCLYDPFFFAHEIEYLSGQLLTVGSGMVAILLMCRHPPTVQSEARCRSFRIGRGQCTDILLASFWQSRRSSPPCNPTGSVCQSPFGCFFLVSRFCSSLAPRASTSHVEAVNPAKSPRFGCFRRESAAAAGSC